VAVAEARHQGLEPHEDFGVAQSRDVRVDRARLGLEARGKRFVPEPHVKPPDLGEQEREVVSPAFVPGQLTAHVPGQPLESRVAAQ
jgi:hypothetical protein